jgi:crossover junction endodeoxyribonuclease RuvC
MKAVRILGVDPGSRLTGYGCIDLIGKQLRHVAHGTLRLSNTGGRAVIPLERRLLSIYEGLSRVILEYRPQIMVVERVFFAKNAVSALKLGQARGAVILSGALHSLSIVEYSPSEVKAALVGHGHADKQQVARMVELLMGCSGFETSDASDGVALAICHAQQLGVSRTALPPAPRKKRMSLAEAVGIAAETERFLRGPKPGRGQ